MGRHAARSSPGWLTCRGPTSRRKPARTTRRLLAAISAVTLMTTALVLGGEATALAATTTVTVPATQPWTNAGVDVSGSVTLQASGTIDVGGPEGNLGPAGSHTGCVAGPSTFSGQWVFNGPPCWSLIAKVGENGQPFAVGNGGTFPVPSGRLYLGVDDEVTAFGDNGASWTVQVITPEPVPTPERPQPSPANCRINVHAALIADPIFDFRHLYVVYTDPSGSTYHYEAYPSGWPSPSGTVKPAPGPGSLSVTPFGIPGIPIPKKSDIDSGSKACGKDANGNPVSGFESQVVAGPHRCFLDQSTRIDQTQIPYQLKKKNSNAYVYTLLKNCGLEKKKPTSDRQTPGWEEVL